MTTPKQDTHGCWGAQCDGCGYTLADAILHGDHDLCGSEPPWHEALAKRSGPEYREARWRALRMAGM